MNPPQRILMISIVVTFLVAAAVGAGAVYFYTNIQQLRNDFADAKKQNADLVAQNEKLNANLKTDEDAYKKLSDGFNSAQDKIKALENALGITKSQLRLAIDQLQVIEKADKTSASPINPCTDIQRLENDSTLRGNCLRLGTLANGLVSYYKLEDATDSFGSNNLTEHGSPTYVSAKVNNGLQLGYNNSSAYLSYPGNMGITEAVSFAMWINFNTLPGNGNTAFVGVANTSNQIAYYLEYYPATGGLIMVRDRLNKIYQLAAYPWNELSTGIWYHLVGTYDGSYLRLYLNGKLVGGPTVSGGGNGLTGAQDAFAIGSYYDGSYKVSALIDEVGVWNRSLSTSEIGDLYNGGGGKAIH